VYLVALGGLITVWFGLLASDANTTTAEIGLYYLAIVAAGIVMQTAFLSGCLDLADEKPVTTGSFFKPRNLGKVIPAGLLVIILTSIGNILYVVPGLIVSFFALFTIAFATDRALPAVKALKASIATIRSNIGGALLSWLVQVLVLTAGALLCGIGMLIAFPLATLIQTYTYRRLTGGTVAPLSE
jgi:uncharacterized membrane protein